jgi:hypothetical protein
VCQQNSVHLGVDVPAAVEEDRPHLVEATIVLIMKARETLNHNYQKTD